MIRVCVMYPAREGARFDLDYYADRHMALVKERLGDALRSSGVDRCVQGGAPGVAAPFVAIGEIRA